MHVYKHGIEIGSLDMWGLIAPPRIPEHWVDGRSAKEFARAWYSESGAPIVPSELKILFGSSSIGPVNFLAGEPEALIPFDNFRSPRQADLSASAIGSGGLIALTIEAKERESFDQPIGKRLDAVEHQPRSNLPERIRRLSLGLFGTNVTSKIKLLRYQLLNGTAATLCLADRSHASMAVFVVFEFRSKATPPVAIQTNQDDLDAFVNLLTAGKFPTLHDGQLIGPVSVPGNQHFKDPRPLYLGKVVRQI